MLTLAYTGRIHSRSDDCFGGGHRNIRTTDTVGESRSYFGLWAIMKSPLLLSSNLPELSAELIAIVNNTEVIRVNQVRTLIPICWRVPPQHTYTRRCSWLTCGSARVLPFNLWN